MSRVLMTVRVWWLTCLQCMQHLPFAYENKRAFGVKLASYMLIGFTLPFVASWYQLCV